MIGQGSAVLVATVGTWLFSAMVGVAAGGATPQAIVPDGWPVKIEERKLYATDHGFVYARDKSAFEQVRKAFAAVVEDANSEKAEALPPGIILVMDTKEKYPCDIARLGAALKKVDPNDPLGKLQDILGAEKKSRELGLDVSSVLSLFPFPIPPSTLHEVISDLPADANEHVKWCVVVPTDQCVKSSFKKMMDAVIMKEKPGLMKRATLAAAMPLIEGRMISIFAKTRQVVLYTLVLSLRKSLSPEQRKAMVKAYQEKIGLDKAFDPNASE